MPLKGHTPVDQMRLAGDVARLIRSKENSKRGDFLGRTETCHRLARDEILAHLFKRSSCLLCDRLHAFLE